MHGRSRGRSTDGDASVTVDDFRHVGRDVEVLELDVGEGVEEVVDRLILSAQLDSSWSSLNRPELCRSSETCAGGANHRVA
eukprot:754931-Hanusia_phi.AAC.3